MTAKHGMRFTYAEVAQYRLIRTHLKGIAMKKLIIIVLVIFAVGYISLMVQYF